MVLSILLLACGRHENLVQDLNRDRRVISVLVIGDGFTNNETQQFTEALARAKTGLSLLERTHNVKFDVHEDFIKSGLLGTSTLGINHHGRPQDCYFDFKAALPTIEARGTKYAPEYFLVVFGADGGGGCADGKTMIVEFSADESTVAHEAGHATIGLYDERGGIAGTPPPIDRTNCSTKDDVPWDDLIKDDTFKEPIPGCRLYDDLFSPSDVCKMVTPTVSKFCAQCERLVQKAMTARATAPPLTAAFPAIRVESVNNSIELKAVLYENGTLKVVEAREIDAAKVVSPLVVGETFAVIEADSLQGEQREIVGITPVAIDDGGPGPANLHDDITPSVPLQARSYSAKGVDTLVRVPARLVQVTLVGVRKNDAVKRHLRLTLRHLERPGRGTILNATTSNRLIVAPIKSTVVDVSIPLATYFAAQ